MVPTRKGGTLLLAFEEFLIGGESRSERSGNKTIGIEEETEMSGRQTLKFEN